jgi:transcriptional regulator with XRE-family HTH domain
MPRKSQIQLPPLDLGKESLGQRLARFRKLRGFTQVELAEQIGIIQSLVSDYERDRLRPHPEMIVRFALALGVSTDELLGLAPPAKKTTGASVNRRLLRRLERIEKLPKRDQDALIRTIDAFLGKAS